MRNMLCGALLAAPLSVFAQHQGESRHEAGLVPPAVKAKPAKPVIAVGAVFDAKGRLWLARVENQHLFVAYSDNGGAGFSEPVRVTPEPESISADGENRPKIAVTADGTVLLTWTQSLPQKYSGNIRFARSTDGGQRFSAPVTLNDDGRITSHRFDSLATDGAGRVAVAWLDARDRDAAREKGGTFSGVSVYLAQSADNGAHFGANRKLTAHTCECCRTSLVWTDAGPVAFWRNLYGANTRDFAIGNPDTAEVRRATDDDWQIDACPHHGGGIAADGSGALHLVWFTNGRNRQGLFYKRIAGAGAGAGTGESVPMAIGNPASQAGHAAVAAAGRMVLISWREFDGRAYVLQAMRSDDGGASWSAPIRLAEAAGAADYPLPLTDGKRALVVWNAAAEGLRVLPVESGAGK